MAAVLEPSVCLAVGLCDRIRETSYRYAAVISVYDLGKRSGNFG